MNLNKNQHTNRDRRSREETGEVASFPIALEVILLILKIFITVCESIFRTIVPVPKKSVQGEIVLITGAGHGIGRELALQYADLDAIVVCWDIHEQANKNVVSHITKKGKTAYGYICDVTNREEVIKTVQTVEREVGKITVLINNAGILEVRSLLEHDEEDIRRTIEINTVSHFWTLQAVLPNMIKNNHGHVVALSSHVGLGGFRNMVPYCASKYAVRGMMSALNEELRYNPQNQIKLTTIFPYIVSTGLCTNYKIRFPQLFKEVTPKVAAECIISAQRRNIVEETIPEFSLTVHNILQTFPKKAVYLIRDFINIRFESNK
ncbi:hypothetical protein RN001_006693 [Aquatica leii]|uniref:Short-chain dehydrogenase/reductase 3 n=1 Tax=Aquatica leii TaxID=1421715 RepID=A0AAN7PDZ7_9COLE|nr:hypothetical protein RN001_006693 [Aquatica leii]